MLSMQSGTVFHASITCCAVVTFGVFSDVVNINLIFYRDRVPVLIFHSENKKFSFFLLTTRLNGSTNSTLYSLLGELNISIIRASKLLVGHLKDNHYMITHLHAELLLFFSFLFASFSAANTYPRGIASNRTSGFALNNSYMVSSSVRQPTAAAANG